jgi:hypothetical protein
LRDWARKNPIHDNLATKTFDAVAEDKTAELSRVLALLGVQAGNKLG